MPTGRARRTSKTAASFGLSRVCDHPFGRPFPPSSHTPQTTADRHGSYLALPRAEALGYSVLPFHGRYAYAERRTPNAERRTPNAERRTPNAERRTPNAERRTPNAERRFCFDAAWKTVKMDAGLQKQPPLKSILDRTGRFVLCPRITHSVGTKSLRDGHATDFHKELLSK
jgi:hypothetical protein